MEHSVAQLLEGSGRIYRKKPGLRGFRACLTADEGFEAYNPLEDASYQGPGIYVTGLLGETWRVASLAKLQASYELDVPGGGAPTEEDLMAAGGCALRYLAQTPPVLAARAGKDVAFVDCDSGDGRTTRLAVNTPTNGRGEAVAHGAGDMIVCSLDAAAGGEGPDVLCFAGPDEQAWAADPRNAYVVNGAVFDATYEEVPGAAETLPQRQDHTGRAGGTA